MHRPTPRWCCPLGRRNAFSGRLQANLLLGQTEDRDRVLHPRAAQHRAQRTVFDAETLFNVHRPRRLLYSRLLRYSRKLCVLGQLCSLDPSNGAASKTFRPSSHATGCDLDIGQLSACPVAVCCTANMCRNQADLASDAPNATLSKSAFTIPTKQWLPLSDEAVEMSYVVWLPW